MAQLSLVVRKQFTEGDEVRDAGLTTPEDIVRYDDIVYGEDDYWQALDVYRPQAAGDEKLPCIVSVHGGAWVYGDKDRYQWYCMSLAQRGFAVVNFTYRLAPEFQFPAGLEDTASVFAWIAANADAYGIDLDNVFAVGDSAGAHMLSMYTAMLSNADYAAEVGVDVSQSPALKAIALNCGAFRIEPPKPEDEGTMTELTSGIMGELLPGGGTVEEYALISPIDHLKAPWPPTFVMTAEGDFLRDGALPFVHALDALDTEVCYHFYKSAERELGHVFHCNMRLVEAARCNDDECDFFSSFVD